VTRRALYVSAAALVGAVALALALGIYPLWNWLVGISAVLGICLITFFYGLYNEGAANHQARGSRLTLCLIVIVALLPLFVISSKNSVVVLQNASCQNLVLTDEFTFAFIPTWHAEAYRPVVVTDSATGLRVVFRLDSARAVEVAQFCNNGSAHYAEMVSDFFREQLAAAKRRMGEDAAPAVVAADFILTTRNAPTWSNPAIAGSHIEVALDARKLF
jgi:hypothetical protein